MFRDHESAGRPLQGWFATATLTMLVMRARRFRVTPTPANRET